MHKYSEQHEVFWIYQPYSLLISTDLIPISCMTLDQKMNSVTRLFILLMLLLLVLHVQNVFLIFCIGLIIIILIYVINYQIEMNTESFENDCGGTIVDNSSFAKTCFTDVNINNLSNYLYVPPPVNNIRFNDPPPFISPSHDIEDWKQSTLVQHSAINGNRAGYSLKQSGYNLNCASTNCGINPPRMTCDEKKLPYRKCLNKKEYKCESKCDTGRKTDFSVPCVRNDMYNKESKIPVYSVKENFQNNNSDNPILEQAVDFYDSLGVNSIKTCERKCKPGVDHVRTKDCNKNCVSLPGDLIEHCGYNPEKGCYGMPHNQPMSIDDYYPTLTDYHTTLNTQILDPSGTYIRTEINEPQMTNMGISFAQQIEPMQTTKIGDEEIITFKDPRLYQVPNAVWDYGELTPDSVFDPRSGGYGDDRRTYIDNVTGQPRFMYDDINSAREGNYFTRNNIDVYNFGQQIGIVDECVNDTPLEVIKAQAQDAFIDNGNSFRTSLQTSLMKKCNEMTRQRRLFPLRGDSHSRGMK